MEGDQRPRGESTVDNRLHDQVVHGEGLWRRCVVLSPRNFCDSIVAVVRPALAARKSVNFYIFLPLRVWFVNCRFSFYGPNFPLETGVIKENGFLVCARK